MGEPCLDDSRYAVSPETSPPGLARKASLPSLLLAVNGSLFDTTTDRIHHRCSPGYRCPHDHCRSYVDYLPHRYRLPGRWDFPGCVSGMVGWSFVRRASITHISSGLPILLPL